MKFIDQAAVRVIAGDGGTGRISFRKEKFVDRGGPDGGDGGDGGNIVFVASRNQNTLMDFRYHTELNAQPGEAGDKVRRHGKRGEDLRVAVPVGTVVSVDGTVIADFTEDGQEAIIAKGGRGGFGNAHFVSSRRQAPKFSEPGGEGEVKDLELELKLIADVGLVGLPNAGKSTLLSVISNARPKIADYPFTTLTPNLGVVDVEGHGGLLMADIPGIIEGAADGKGLGDEFLRHVERTAVLLHLIDASSDDIVRDYATIQAELKLYRINLADKPQLVALTKIDMVSPEEIKNAVKLLEKKLPNRVKLLQISSVAHKGLRELLFTLSDIVEKSRAAAELIEEDEQTGLPVLTLDGADEHWTVEGGDGEFWVKGGIADKFSARTDFDNEESLQRLRSIFQKQGIMHELSRRHARRGAVVHTLSGDFEL